MPEFRILTRCDDVDPIPRRFLTRTDDFFGSPAHLTLSNKLIRRWWPSELCALIDDGWALLIDDQHQSLSLKGSPGISRVVGEVFRHLNLAERD